MEIDVETADCAGATSLEALLERLVASDLQELPETERPARVQLLSDRKLTPRIVAAATFDELAAAVCARYNERLGVGNARLGGYGWSSARIVSTVAHTSLRQRVDNMRSLLRTGDVALGVVQDWEAMDDVAVTWAHCQDKHKLGALFATGGALREYCAAQQQQQQQPSSQDEGLAGGNKAGQRDEAQELEALLLAGGLQVGVDGA